jgi:hypothetical protein
VLLHQFFGEDLARLYPGGLLRRPEDGESVFRKEVDDPIGQRLLRPDYRQVYAVLLREIEQPFAVLGFDIDVVRYFRRPGVARRRVKLFNFRALSYLPGNGMLPAAFSYDENFNLNHAP